MIETIADEFMNFVGVLRRSAAFPVEVMLPGVVILLAWPLLRVWLDDQGQAFMVAFVLGMGLRLALKSETLIRRTRAHFTGAATVPLILICGPGLLSLLVFAAEPIYCQRFLSIYFLMASALYVLDVIDGNYAMVRARYPEVWMRRTDGTLTRALAVYNLAMVLANETLIASASQSTWLLYFGLLPLFSTTIRRAVVRSVHEGHGLPV